MPYPFPYPLPPPHPLSPPNLLYQRRPEEPQQQVLLALVRSVVVDAEDGRLHEARRPAGRHLEDEAREVDGLRLEEVEEVLVGLEAVATRAAQRLQAGGQRRRRRVAVLAQRLVVRHNVLRGGGGGALGTG